MLNNQSYRSNRKTSVDMHVDPKKLNDIVKKQIKLTDKDYQNINAFFADEAFLLAISEKTLNLSLEFSLNNTESFQENCAIFSNLYSSLKKIFSTLEYDKRSKEKFIIQVNTKFLLKKIKNFTVQNKPKTVFYNFLLGIVNKPDNINQPIENKLSNVDPIQDKALDQNVINEEFITSNNQNNNDNNDGNEESLDVISDEENNKIIEQRAWSNTMRRLSRMHIELLNGSVEDYDQNNLNKINKIIESGESENENDEIKQSNNPNESDDNIEDPNQVTVNSIVNSDPDNLEDQSQRIVNCIVNNALKTIDDTRVDLADHHNDNENQLLLSRQSSQVEKINDDKDQEPNYQALKFQITCITEYIFRSIKFLFCISALDTVDKSKEPQEIKNLIETSQKFNFFTGPIAQIEFNDYMDIKTQKKGSDRN